MRRPSGNASWSRASTKCGGEDVRIKVRRTLPNKYVAQTGCRPLLEAYEGLGMRQPAH